MLSDKSLKLLNEFKYLGSSISFTERNSNIHTATVKIAIDKLLIIWKSDLPDKIKQFSLA